MVKSFPKVDEGHLKDTEHSDNFCLGDIDLLNLRLNFSSEHVESKNRNSSVQNPSYRFSEKGSGDTIYSSRQRHSLEKTNIRTLVPNLSKLPKGYGKFDPSATPIPSVNLLYLYSKEQTPEYVTPEPISRKDFLFPSKKKTRTKVIDVVSEDRMSKYNSRTNKVDSGSFPFKLTPSGNLKVQTSQVVFSSNKLSVLVADPKNTKINIHPETNYSKMAHEADFSKTSAMDTIMSQAGLSSLGTLIGNTPVRTGNKEASEYESKQTSEILDPELNLGRLGYGGNDEICWPNVILPEKKNLYLELYSRITNYTNADCKVYIDNEEFNCHLIVLQCYSELFDAYIAVKKVELPSDKCSAAAFALIYEWMITGEPSYKELSRDNVLDIFNSAKYLKIKDLVEQCWAFIDHSDVFNEDTAFLLYMDAKEKDLPEVRELMLPRIQGFFLMLVSSQNWLELDLEDVKNLLQSNYICVNCEMEVFMSAVRWLKHDWVTRDQFKYEVLACVRFGNIAPWQLVDIKRNPENPDFQELARDPQICKMIDDGLAYVIIKYWYGQENDDFSHWNQVLGLQEPPPRNWSGSDKTYFTYREFLIYLDQYRRNQLIEKNKPRMGADPKLDVRDIRKNQAREVEKNSPRVPTMEEFMSKKKFQPASSSHIYPSTKTPDKRFADRGPSSFWKSDDMACKVEAAIKIQRAFRRYRRQKMMKMLKKDIRKKHKSVTPYRKTRNDGILSDVLNKLSLSRNRPSKLKPNIVCTTVPCPVKKQLLTKNSLFHKTRETVLVFGGLDPHGDYGVDKNTATNIFQYNPDNNSWVFVGELPHPRHHHSAEFHKGRIYIVGGGDPRESEFEGKSSVVGTVWSFDPVTRQWFDELPLLEPRKNFGLVACSQGLYAIGGQGKQYEALKTVERFNVDKSCWESMASLQRERTGLCCTKYKNSILVAGGLASGDRKIDILDSVESYDIKNNQWTSFSQKLRIPRCFSCMTVISEMMYILGGAGKTVEDRKTTTSLGTVDLWDENKSEWTLVTKLNIPRHGHTVSCLGTQILIIGGVTTMYSRALSNVECFCSQRETWVRGLACMPTALSGHAAVTLPPVSLLSY